MKFISGLRGGEASCHRFFCSQLWCFLDLLLLVKRSQNCGKEQRWTANRRATTRDADSSDQPTRHRPTSSLHPIEQTPRPRPRMPSTRMCSRDLLCARGAGARGRRDKSSRFSGCEATPAREKKTSTLAGVPCGWPCNQSIVFFFVVSFFVLCARGLSPQSRAHLFFFCLWKNGLFFCSSSSLLFLFLFLFSVFLRRRKNGETHPLDLQRIRKIERLYNYYSSFIHSIISTIHYSKYSSLQNGDRSALSKHGSQGSQWSFDVIVLETYQLMCAFVCGQMWVYIKHINHSRLLQMETHSGELTVIWACQWVYDYSSTQMHTSVNISLHKHIERSLTPVFRIANKNENPFF